MCTTLVIMIYVGWTCGAGLVDPGAELRGVPVRVVSGAYWRRLPSVTTYEASVPLLFRSSWLTVPTSVDDLLPLAQSLCPGGPSLCSLARDTDALQKTFREQLNNVVIHSAPEFKCFVCEYVVYNETIRTERGIIWVGDALDWCCDVATNSKLQPLVKQQMSIQDQIKNIESIVHTDHLNLIKNTEGLSKYDEIVKESFKDVQLRVNNLTNVLRNIQYNSNHKIENITSEMYSVFVSSFLNLRGSVELLNVIKQSEILQQCRNRLIPNLVVPKKVLFEDLVSLDSKLRAEGYKLAIPARELETYYKIKISDCSIESNEILVHVQVPIISKNNNWQLFDLVSSAFSWESQTCVLVHEKMFLAVSGSDLKIISGSALFQCKPHENFLCYVPHYISDIMFGSSCAVKLYTGATVAELNQHCAFQCQVSQALLVNEVEKELYIITNPRSSLEVICNGNNRTVIKNPLNGGPGAVQLHVPCRCSVSSEGRQIISESFPCDSRGVKDFQIFHVLPALWTNLNSLRIHSKKAHFTMFDNYSDFLNSNWTIKTPHLNLTSPPVLTDYVSDPQLVFGNIDNTFKLVDLLCCWVILLTFFMFLIVVKNPHLLFFMQIGVADAHLFVDDLKSDLFMIFVVIIIMFLFGSNCISYVRSCLLRKRVENAAVNGLLIIDGVAHSITLNPREVGMMNEINRPLMPPPPV